MSTINGENYTNFRGVNVYDGIVRLADPWENTTYVATTVGDYGVSLAVAPTTLTANRTIYMTDGDGSMMLYGHDIIYGTATFAGSGNVAANTVAQSSVTVSGGVPGCIVLISAATTAQVAGYIPIGAKFLETAKIWVFYRTLGATAAATNVPFNYTVLYPQTT